MVNHGKGPRKYSKVIFDTSAQASCLTEKLFRKFPINTCPRKKSQTEDLWEQEGKPLDLRENINAK
jgi:hypothetical protein